MSSTPPLVINEIFHSLQGETSRAGLPTVFVRLTGCPLRCGYCDSEYAFFGGEKMSIERILEQVAGYGAHYVTVTGGEPLVQKGCLPLLTALADAGYSISLETSGALAIEAVDPRIARIVDVKTPGSGELERMRWENLDDLRASDEVKFVLCDRADYDWAKGILSEYRLIERCPVLFSPVYETVTPRELADWVLADKLQVRVQIQLHKLLWGEGPGH